MSKVVSIVDWLQQCESSCKMRPIMLEEMRAAWLIDEMNVSQEGESAVMTVRASSLSERGSPRQLSFSERAQSSQICFSISAPLAMANFINCHLTMIVDMDP